MKFIKTGKTLLFYIATMVFTGIAFICAAQQEPLTAFGKTEWKASAIPLRPGQPGKAPFWNVFAKRFIYAPAFNFKVIDGAVKYKYEVLSVKNSKTYTFESDIPYAALSPVWVTVPVGNFDLKVTGISKEGKELGTAGEGRYFRAAPFNGPYLEPVMPYDKSGTLALDKIMEKPYVKYWLDHKAPDPSYEFYRHPAKLFGSLIVGAVTHAKLHKGTKQADESITLARIVADYLINISFPKGSYLEYFPPSYSAEAAARLPHMTTSNYMIIAAAESGQAYLDLYDYTKDQKYLEAAKRIAATYLKTQQSNGSWTLYLNPETGKPTAEQFAIPTSTINYFERLKNDYGVQGLEEPIQHAFNWIMEHPVKTFYWTAQYEDIPLAGRPDYKKMSREQPCDFAIYLFKKYPNNKKYTELAEDLIRFCEDQFITWEQMEDLVVNNGTDWRPAREGITTEGWYSRNWLLPVVHEQYGFWMPSGRNTGLMIETYWHAYAATKKKIYLAKAKSIANNFTRVQQLHNGDYPTMFTKYPMNFWINNSIYPARVMMNLQHDLDKGKL